MFLSAQRNDRFRWTYLSLGRNRRKDERKGNDDDLVGGEEFHGVWLVGWLVVWLFNEAVSVGNDLFGSVFVVVGWLLC